MSPRLRNLLLTTTALIALGAAPAAPQPNGGTVVGGTANISGQGTQSVIVNQSSERAIINWNTFNIATGGAATFNQPGTSSITLNRVTGGLGASTIDGTITANGRVFIINRDGMLFGRNAVINTAGFLATTHDIRDDDFMAGRMNFNIRGRNDASIVNLGTINATNRGFAALVAPGVRNSGTITARLGTVALASGNSFTLDMYGDRLIQLAVGDEIAGKVIDVATGQPLSSLVSNDGRISANGGRVELTAAAARHVVDSVINNSGVIEANSIGQRNGRIVLGAATSSARGNSGDINLPKQTVKISGKITATGKRKGQTGGTIQITGEDIQFAAAMLDVSGHSGGGKILVGGDYGGGRPIPGTVNNPSAVLENYAIPTATTVTVDGATTFNASATATGNGGKVILWSDTVTSFAGTIYARGGALGGDGGFVEVSGKQQLAYSGLVNTLAPNGRAGTLLLDPDDYTINALEAATIVANLLTTPVIITTSASGVGGVGNITVNAPILWATAHGLTLSAYQNVIVNANITNTANAPVTLRADNSGTANNMGAVNFNSASVSTSGNVSIFYNPPTYGTPTNYIPFVGGGATLTAYMLVNTVQNLQAISSNLTGTYALGRDIDATGFGFTPLATLDGILDGQNHTITGLTTTGAAPFTAVDGEIRNLNLVNVSVTATANGQTIAGLVGTLSGGTVSNVSISGTVNATGLTSITAGGLVGENQGTIQNSSAAVNVTIGNGTPSGGSGFNRDAHAGGLVGINYGLVTQSSASGNVMGGGNSLIGGLVGSNGSMSMGGSISESFATGTVTGVAPSLHYALIAGGLVGDNWGSITNSYATGNVSVSGPVIIMNVGGLVGQLMSASIESFGTITKSYASGNVTINNTYNDNADGSAAGGLVGATQAYTTISDTYALGNVTVFSADATNPVSAGGLIGLHGGDGYSGASVTRSYSTGLVSGTGPGTYHLGGFIGLANIAANKTDSYWDKETSGQQNAIGLVTGQGAPGQTSIQGLTTSEARTQSCFNSAACGGTGAFNFATTWFMVDGQTRPFLRMEHSTTVRNAHQLQLMAMNLAANYTLHNSIDFTGQFNASGMWGARGFAPIGQGQFFTGSLNGDAFTINALMIAPNNATLQSVGMFGAIGGAGSVTNLNFTNASVAANIGFTSPNFSQWVGILAGQSGGTISNVTAAGTVSGLSLAGVIAGGLVGQHGILGQGGVGGTITNSHATVNVAVADGDPCPGTCRFNIAGGLVGSNVAGSTISASSAHGNVTGGASVFAGGLVGQNGFIVPVTAGFITNSYATGNVTVTGNQSAAGGLVGSNVPGSTITNSQAFGNVASTFDGTAFDDNMSAGGLVGANAGTITSTSAPVASAPPGTAAIASNCSQGGGFSCATGNVSVGAGGAGGGLVGHNQGTINRSFAIGNVSGVSAIGMEQVTQLGGLAGVNRGTITNSFAHTGTIGSITTDFLAAGGLVGDNSGTISNSSASGNVFVGNFSVAGGLAANNSSDGGFIPEGDGASNDAAITNSSARGAVSVGTLSFGGGFIGANNGTINSSFATGVVTGRTLSMIGGFAAANAGTITNSHATGNVTTDMGFAGGFIGFNFGSIGLSYATGNVSSTGFAFLGGFVGVNSGAINQAYTTGAVSGGPGSFVGGFVGLNAAAEIVLENAAASSAAPPAAAAGQYGVISQSYALGPVTGSNAVVAAGFAALNLGVLDQVYAAGHVQGGAGTVLGGLVGANGLAAILPELGLPTTISLPAGTVTNSFWDMQTTGLTTSAGGTGMNTSVLAGGLPPGFDPTVWSHGSYPYLVNLGSQNTDPGPPVIPPVVENVTLPTLPPPNQQISPPAINNAQAASASLNTPQLVQQLQQQQQQQAQQQPQQQQQAQGPVGGTGLPAPQPIRLDVGENRFFYLPPLGETRLISNEVVLQLPCDVPQAELNAILKQHNLSVLGSECLQTGGNAAYRVRYASGQTIAGVIRALAANRIVAAAQANYSYTLAQPQVQSSEQKVQAATSHQGDPGQYVPEKLRLAEIHRTIRGTNVAVAVIDSEIDGAHPDLNGAISNRFDTSGGAETPHPHGTGMAGAIVSRQKLLGVAPGAQVFAVRAFSSRAANAESTTFNILRGLDWAVNNKIRIVNMSFAGPRDPSLERALKAAYDRGTILIAAMGNAGMRSPPLYPAADQHVIAVTATDSDDALFTGANRGNYVAIAAPGVDILVPAPNGEYQVTTGTSVATAHISGVVALMLERNPRLSPADVRKILIGTAKRLGPTNQFGAGLVDPVRALEMAAPRSAAVAPAPTAR